MNILENMPYKTESMGKRKLVDEDHLLVMQIALKAGQSVPRHNANSNVHLLVIKGEISINLREAEYQAKEGELLPVAYRTPMTIKNNTKKDAAFLVFKTPNPSEMI